jgi:hypothetical protein
MWQSCRHGGVQLCVHGVVQLLPMQEVEPPLQLALAKPAAATASPQTFTGTLTGAVIVLPEPTGMLKLPVTLPLWLWPPTPEMVEAAPPAQPALEKPSRASEMPHREGRRRRPGTLPSRIQSVTSTSQGVFMARKTRI